jgi:hypothetical protein
MDPRIARFNMRLLLPIGITPNSSAAIGGASAFIGVSKAFRQP